MRPPGFSVIMDTGVWFAMKEKIKLRGHLRRYLRWPLYFLVLLGILNIVVYHLDVRAGVAVTIGIALYALIAAIVLKFQSPAVINDLTAYAMEYDSLEKKMLNDLALPYLILDINGKVIWANENARNLIGRKDLYGKYVESFFPAVSKGRLPSWESGGRSEVIAPYGDSIFRIYMTQLSLKNVLERSGIVHEVDFDKNLVAMYLYDETELREYIQKYEDDKTVFALAELDNYDEALQSVEDVRRSLLIALIDRKITRYFAGFDGLVKKLEKDKYLILLKNSSLEALKEQRFHILDEVKTVNIGNEMPVTISMGIGVHAPGYLQNYEYSRIAIEMALGRGGDQVVLKDGATISYFGGKALQMEKNTRVKARVKAQALKEFISSKEEVVVMGHKITDVDALGAGIGIYRAAKSLGKSVHIVVNDPSASIRPLMTEFRDNQEYEPDMFIDGAKAREIVNDNTVVVVVDTNKPSYTECPELLERTRTIVVLDHHRRGSEAIEQAVLSYVEPYASSACEMVAEILQYFSDDLKIRNLEADCMYAGIIVDTNNFTTRSGVRTFEAAAFLRRCGADVTRVRKMLRDNFASYQARAEAVRSAHIYKGSYAIARCPGEGLESPTVVGAQAANELLNIAGVKASFVLTPFRDEIYISARALDEVNVQVMMEKMGGGGHLNVAGTQVKCSIDEAEEMLRNTIDEFVQEQEDI